MPEERQSEQLQESLNINETVRKKFNIRKIKNVFSKNNLAKKPNKILFISLILTFIYLFSSFITLINTIKKMTSSMNIIGEGLIMLIVLPHYLSVVIGFIFNGIGLFLERKVFVLTSAILYSVAILFFPLYFPFIITQMILSYIGFTQMKNQ